jgi:hypothetical protein
MQIADKDKLSVQVAKVQASLDERGKLHDAAVEALQTLSEQHGTEVANGAAAVAEIQKLVAELAAAGMWTLQMRFLS